MISVSGSYRPEIDGLRAVSIMAVILYHARLRAFSGGYVGVDIFFVISGYVITRNIAKQLLGNRFSLPQFWLRRARRILPALLAMMLFTAVAAWFILMPTDFRNFGRSLFAQSAFVSNFYFWLKSGYFNEEVDTMPLLHTWSLSVEEQFYIFWPPLLLLLWRIPSKWRVSAVLGAIVVSLGFSAALITTNRDAVFFLLPTRAWELLLGALLVMFETTRRRNHKWAPWLLEASAVGGIAAIAASIVGYDQNTVFPGLAAVVPCGGAAAIIASGGVHRTRVAQSLSTRIPVLIGLISYSLYLWHWPVLVFARYISVKPLTPIVLILSLSIGLALSVMSYQYIERPFRYGAIKVRPALLVFSTGAIVALVCGALINLHEGYPGRMPERTLAAYTKASYIPPKTLVDVKVSDELPIEAMRADLPPDVLLWGDSHAGTIAPVLAELAKQHRQNLWRYACIPLLGVYNVARDTALANSECDRSNRAMIEYIARHRVKKIVLASFWSQFTEGRELPLDGAGQRDNFYADKVTASRNATDARIVFRRNFLETIRILGDLGATVFIVDQVPVYRYWVPNQMVKVMRFGGDLSNIRRPLSEHEQRMAFINETFAEVIGSKVHLLDPVPYLCDTRVGFCYGVDGETSLYRDYNHLSYEGVRRIKPLLEKIFQDVDQ
jgi:peptidoglycan/LPS O-acetylase OafA/YrhL